LDVQIDGTVVPVVRKETEGRQGNGQPVGEYFSDLLVEDALVVELQCAERLASQHRPMSQLSARL
jgi:hypothetical protein